MSRRASTRRNAVAGLAVQGTTAVFTAALTLYLVRTLGPESYGVFALALAVGAFALVPSDLGISASTARFIAAQVGDPAAIAGTVRAGLKLKATVAGAAAAALFAGAGTASRAFGEAALTWPIRGVAVAVFGQAILSLVTHAFVAQGRIPSNLRLVVSESAVEVAATVGLVALGTGATGAAFGRAAGYLFGAALGLFMLFRLLGRRTPVSAESEPTTLKRIAVYATALAVVDAAWTLFGTVDRILIGAFLGTTSVALLAAPSRMLIVLHYPGLALANAVAPRLVAEDDRMSSSRLVTAIRMLILFQAAASTSLLVWAEPLVRSVLGTDYLGSVPVVRVLALYVLFSGLAPLASISINYLGEVRRRIPIAIATVVVNVVIDLILIPPLEVVGAAIGATAGITVYVGGHLWVLRSIRPFPVAPILWTCVRAAAACVALAGVLAAHGFVQLSLGQWISGLALGTATYGLVLVLTGEIRPEVALKWLRSVGSGASSRRR